MPEEARSLTSRRGALSLELMASHGSTSDAGNGPGRAHGIDLSLLDVVGPFGASVHTYDVATRTWDATHAAVSIEQTPFAGDIHSAWRCFKIYHSDRDGRVLVLVGKESVMSQMTCHDHVLSQLIARDCVEAMNDQLGVRTAGCQEMHCRALTTQHMFICDRLHANAVHVRLFLRV